MSDYRKHVLFSFLKPAAPSYYPNLKAKINQSSTILKIWVEINFSCNMDFYKYFTGLDQVDFQLFQHFVTVKLLLEPQRCKMGGNDQNETFSKFQKKSEFFWKQVDFPVFVASGDDFLLYLPPDIFGKKKVPPLLKILLMDQSS